MSAATKVILPIRGMSCSACQAHVEATLRATPGVASASVSLLANQATVEGTASLDTLIAAVHDAGYEATAPSAEPITESDEHLALRAGLALGAAVVAMLLSMPLMMATGTPDPLLHAVNGLLQNVTPDWLMSLPVEPIRWLLLAMTAAVMIFASPDTYRRAYTAALHRATNMNTLVAIGTLAAFFYSAVATIAPVAFTRHGLAPDVYFEAVDFILAFLLIGSVLDARAKQRTQSALSGFAKLQPATARVLRDGGEVEVPVVEVQPADTIQLRPGERVPVDGIVLTGESSVDEALITGESHPILKRAGDAVIGGTINLDGPLSIRATSLGAASVLGQMQRLLSEAQASRAPMQKLADRASAIFVPTILGLAIVTFGLWLWLDGSLPRAFSIAIAVLVIACPCAMGLAVPAALTVGIGRAAQLGVLVKNGEALERLAGTTIVTFDKTGTLTEGHPVITDVQLAAGGDQAKLLAIAAALEQHSEHPAGTRRAGLCRGGTAPDADRHQDDSRPGDYGKLRWTAGCDRQRHAARSTWCTTDEARSRLVHRALSRGEWRARSYAGGSRYAARVGSRGDSSTRRPTHCLAHADWRHAQHGFDHRAGGRNPCRPNPRRPVAGGEALDHPRSAKAGASVAMAGDGLNDAASLAQADTGIAVSTGTDLTREAADLILMASLSAAEIDLRMIPTAIRLARRTVRSMRQNLGWAMAYNAFGIPSPPGCSTRTSTSSSVPCLRRRPWRFRAPRCCSTHCGCGGFISISGVSSGHGYDPHLGSSGCSRLRLSPLPGGEWRRNRHRARREACRRARPARVQRGRTVTEIATALKTLEAGRGEPLRMGADFADDLDEIIPQSPAERLREYVGLIADTSVLIQGERSGMSVSAILVSLRATYPDEEFAISVITIAELTHGIYRAQSATRAEERSRFVDDIHATIPIHNLSPAIATLTGRLEGEQATLGITIPFQDLVIGATALDLGFSVLTANIRHFTLIPGLTLLRF